MNDKTYKILFDAVNEYAESVVGINFSKYPDKLSNEKLFTYNDLYNVASHALDKSEGVLIGFGIDLIADRIKNKRIVNFYGW